MTDLVEKIAWELMITSGSPSCQPADYLPDAKAALRAIKDAGYAVVPVEITEEMYDATEAQIPDVALEKFARATHDSGLRNDAIEAVYEALLTAAPDITGDEK